MRKRFYIWVGVIALAIVVGVLFGPAHRKDVPQPAPAVAARNEPGSAAVTSEGPERQEPAEPSTQLQETVITRDPSPPVAQTNDQTFHINPSGRLLIDQETRLNMEALFARTDRERLEEAKQEATEPLPAAAREQAVELLDHYDNYQQAQKQAYPPGNAPATEEAALAELDGLHALRVAHFGPVVARALYGEEEAVSRRLVELMRLEKDQSLTVEEKAERAQQLLYQTPSDPH
jgi:lipase chaperone protein